MSKTFMRGLEIVQYVDLFGPIGINELSRHFDVDKGSISRLVSAAEVDGWLLRTPGGVVLGPRAALLGDISPIAQAVQDARGLLDAISGVTGLASQALVLSGTRAVGLAAGGPSAATPSAYTRRPRFPLWAGAAGKVVASQVDSAELDQLLPPDPFPEPEAIGTEWTDAQLRKDLIEVPQKPAPPGQTSTLVSTRAALDKQLAQIRKTGMFREYAEMLPELGCIAVPWHQHGTPAALACIGQLAEIESQHEVVETALRAAARPGATRDDVVVAAAATLRHGVVETVLHAAATADDPARRP